VIPKTFYHLRCCIARTSTGSFEHLTLSVKISKTKINQFDIVVVVEEDIFWFQIPVYNTYFMNILYPGYYLLVVFACFFLLETLRFPDLLKQLVPRAIFHDEEQIFVIFDDLCRNMKNKKELRQRAVQRGDASTF
jgi:hypothetical protein